MYGDDVEDQSTAPLKFPSKNEEDQPTAPLELYGHHEEDQPTAPQELYGDDEEDQPTAPSKLTKKHVGTISTPTNLPLYISLLRKNRILPMKNKELQIKVKTLTDESRQKELLID